MRKGVGILSALLVLIFLLSAFSGSVHGNDLVPVYKGFDQNLLFGEKIGPIDPYKKIQVSIALKLKNENQLDQFLLDVQNPDSPMFHKFLTKAEFESLYSPTPEEFNTVYAYLKSLGLNVSPGPYRLAIFIDDYAYKIENAFHVKLYLFKSTNPHYNEIYFAPSGPILLPFYVAQYVKGFWGLTNAYKYHINIASVKNIGNNFIVSNGVQLIGGADLQKVYQTYELYNGSATGASSSTHYFPTQYTIATILWEGTDSSGTQVAPYNPTDVQTYFKNVLPAWEQNIVGTISVTGKGTSGTVAPGSSASNDVNGVNVENTLDLEMVGTLAPGASLVCVYGPGATNGGPSESNFPDNEYAIASQLSNLIAVSNSWGDGDSQSSSTTDNYVKQMEATGTTVFASAGDDGDTSTQSNPANDAQNTFGFVAVGGTTLTLNGVAGSYNGAGTPLNNPIKSQIVWYDSRSTTSNGDHWGTTSGTSTVYPIPSWQNIPAVINNGGSTSGRNVADIAAIGNNTLIYVNGAWNSVAGTSVSSPVVAGIVASMAAYLNQKFGFIDPLFYQIGANQSTYSLKPYYDVTQTPSGYHKGQTTYYAKAGWDYPTGWGSINAWNFTQIVKGLGSGSATYTVTFTESGLPSGTTWSVTLAGTTKSSSTNTITFSEPNGSYSFTVGSVSGYTASPSSGTINVNGANVNQAITFTASAQNVVKVYSYVNSTSISTYSLPEAEAFTVGSSTVNVNFVVLYLSGSGSIKFSIGSSLWKADKLANTTVNVVSGKYWYNVSIPTITLNGNTNYYLNVYLASGSVQWGYTSSPSSSSFNYVQDYWYSGGTLYHDNSYPNIYTIGYSGTSSPTPTTYTVTFTESGLPSGTTWSVTLAGTTKSSSTNTITFSEPNGSYSFSVGSVSGYTASPSSGTINVNGANVNQAITFTASAQNVVKVYSYVNSTSISTYSLPEAEAFTVGSSTVNVNFVVLYLSGSGSIKFSIGSSLWKADKLANTTVNVVSGKYWYNVSIPTTTLNGNTNYYLNVYLASGSVKWGYTSSPSSSSFNYVQDYWYSGGTLYHDNSYPNIYTIGYSGTSSPTPTIYTVTFTESGLPSGTTWSVTLAGTTKSSSTNTITFSEPNGSYSFTVGSVNGYTASPSSGTINVNGANVNQAITFTASAQNVVKVYSYVNSTSISTYSLPEAEAFTVGSSTVNVNFVVLYLSGSGSIKFSIGSSLWKADKLANTTVNVVSGKYWYNVSIPTTTLNGNTNYYLNVYLASGSVKWGYTSSPSSSSFNYVQDYWYSGGTLYHDNSYPNIYTIGYSGTATQTTYTVTFKESGLPSGTTWSVTLAGTTKSSSTNTISFSEPNGSYSFSVGSVNGYTACPSSGTIKVNGSNILKTFNFSRL